MADFLFLGMKVISTNIGPSTTVEWNGKTIQTGIYKYPIEIPIELQNEAVANDVIADRKVHGGIFKACYLFSSGAYPFWEKKYPHLEWDWGMFGENLTIEGLDEAKLRIGSIYNIGTALVQITQPREPCFKLGIRFGTQQVLKEFIDHGQSGTYVKILKKGLVKKGDTMQLQEEATSSLTIKQFFDLLFAKQKDKELIHLAIANEALPAYKRERLKKWL